MKNQEFRKDSDNRYIALTGEVAPNLPSLFIAFAGNTPAEVKETVIPAGRLPPEVVTDVPDDWKEAFRPHGFEFEEPGDAVLTGIDAEIVLLKKRMELEVLTIQLVRGVQFTPTYSGSFDIPFWWFAVMVLGGAWVFAAMLKLLA